MLTRLIHVFVTTVIAILVMLAFPGPAAAQSASAADKTIPRTADGKPDFSGFWSSPVTIGKKGGVIILDEKKMAPLKPGGEPLYEMHTGNVRHDEPRAFCALSGFPWGMFSPYPVQILETPEYFVMVHEMQRMTRIIPTDNRAHLKDVEPGYQGDSVAHWEGETLVIDTTNFKRWILDDYHYTDSTKNRMHSDALHTIERLQRTDVNTITYRLTIDDPKIFTRPWSEDFLMKAHPEYAKTGLFEFACQENNRCEGGTCSPSESK